MEFIKKILSLFKSSFDIFKENHPIKFASAIAYFSLFALPSIFLIIVYILSIFFTDTEVLRELREQLAEVVGSEGANVLVVITENYQEQAEENILSLVGYAVVIFWLSTQLFRLFQNALNDLWRIKPDFKSYWTKLWTERGLTFFLVLGTGLLFFSSVVVERVLEFAIGMAGQEVGIIHVLINAITVLFVFFWFSFLYKVLPAVKIMWGPTFAGAAVTTVLFVIGYLVLWELVVERDLEELFGIVAPIITVALWLFYSSLVFLFGASLTKAYASLQGKDIAPAHYAFKYRIIRDEDFHKGTTEIPNQPG